MNERQAMTRSCTPSHLPRGKESCWALPSVWVGGVCALAQDAVLGTCPGDGQHFFLDIVVKIVGFGISRPGFEPWLH